MEAQVSLSALGTKNWLEGRGSKGSETSDVLLDPIFKRYVFDNEL